MAGGDLDIAQADAGVQHRGHERGPEHMRVHAWHPDPGSNGQVVEPSGGSVAVHANAEHIAQDRAVVAVADRAVDCPADRWWQWNEDDFAALSSHP